MTSFEEPTGRQLVVWWAHPQNDKTSCRSFNLDEWTLQEGEKGFGLSRVKDGQRETCVIPHTSIQYVQLLEPVDEDGNGEDRGADASWEPVSS